MLKPNTPVHLEEVDGFYYEPKNDEAGVPFRWTRDYASLFVPATAKRVETSGPRACRHHRRTTRC